MHSVISVKFRVLFFRSEMVSDKIVKQGLYVAQAGFKTYKTITYQVRKW